MIAFVVMNAFAMLKSLPTKHIVIYGTLRAMSFLVLSGYHSTFHLWPVHTGTVLSWPIIILLSVSLECNMPVVKKQVTSKKVQVCKNTTQSANQRQQYSPEPHSIAGNCSKSRVA